MSMFVAGDLNLLLLKGKLFPLFLPGGSFAGPVVLLKFYLTVCMRDFSCDVYK